MPTFRINTFITKSNQKARRDIGSYSKAFHYKGEPSDLNSREPLEIFPGESIEIDLNERKFFLMVPDDFGREGEIINLTFTNLDNEIYTFEGVSFFYTSIKNTQNVKIENISEESVIVHVEY